MMSSQRHWQDKKEEERLPRLPTGPQRHEREARRYLAVEDSSRSLPVLLKRKESLMAFDPVVVKFVRNGDKFFEGVKVNVSKRIVKSWDVLLSDLSTKINLPAGVRNVYTPEHGHKVTRLSQLEHHGTYVCGSTEPFKRIDYSNLKHPDWKSPTKNRNQDSGVESVFARNYSIDLSCSMQSIRPKLNSSLNSSMSENHLPLRRKPRKLRPLRQSSLTAPDETLEANIHRANSPTVNTVAQETVSFTIFRNGPLPRERVSVILKKDSSWESIKQLISRNFVSINGCLRLFTLSGAAVTSLSELWRAGFIMIAAGAETFDISTFLSGEGIKTSSTHSTNVIATSQPVQEEQEMSQNQSTTNESTTELNNDPTNDTSLEKSTSNITKTSEPIEANVTETKEEILPTNHSHTNQDSTASVDVSDSTSHTHPAHMFPEEDTTPHTPPAHTFPEEETTPHTPPAHTFPEEETTPHTSHTLPEEETTSHTSPAHIIPEEETTPHMLPAHMLPEEEIRPRALSLLSAKYSYDRPSSVSSDELDTPMGKALYPRHVLPKTPQSDISLAVGCPQSMIDMMIPKLHLLRVDSDSGSETSDVPPRPQRRSVGIQTEFVSDQLSTVIDLSQHQGNEVQVDVETVTSYSSEPTDGASERPFIGHHSNKQTRDKYNMGATMHQGRYATVHTCTSKSNDQEYFVRVFNKAKIFWNDDHILREIKILTKLRHEHVMTVIDQWETSDEICMVMEPTEGSDLYDCIQHCKVFSESDTVKVMHQLGLALVYLHANSIVHRDIRLENIFLTVHDGDGWSLKLGGFSLATTVTEPLCMECGKEYFRAPEMRAGTGYSTKVDVWAAGMLCYLLLSGKMPFTRKSQVDLASLNRMFPATYWSAVSEDARDFIVYLLQPNPQLRHTSSQMMQHKWINDVPKSGREDKSRQLMEHIHTQAADNITSVLVLSVTALDHRPTSKIPKQENQSN